MLRRDGAAFRSQCAAKRSRWTISCCRWQRAVGTAIWSAVVIVLIGVLFNGTLMTGGLSAAVFSGSRVV